MRATIMLKAHDVRIDNIPDAAIQQSTDAVIRITRACICGSRPLALQRRPERRRPTHGPRGDRRRR